MSCIVCSDVIRAEVANGTLQRDISGFELVKDKAGAVIDAYCMKCKSRGRMRAIASQLARNRTIYAPPKKLLMVSASPQERRHYELYFGESDHVSLYGDFDDPRCRTGVDITVSPLGGPYDFIIALGVMDFIPEPEKVFRNVRHALNAQGVFIFYVMPYRLDEQEDSVRIANYKGLRNASYMRDKGDETGVPNCRFNPRAFDGWICGAGLIPGEIFEFDSPSKLTHRFFTASRAFEE